MKFSFIEANKARDDANFIEKWKELLNHSKNLDVIYQSPEWFETIGEHRGLRNLFVGLFYNSLPEISGVTPISLAGYKLKFDLYSKTFTNVNLKSVYILGSELLVPREDEVYDEFFTSLRNHFKKIDCIVFESIKIDSYEWDYINRSKIVRKNFITYLPDQVREYHHIILSDTFDEYLHSFSHKRRNDYTRRLRKLERDHNPIVLKLYQKPEDVEGFLEYASEIEKDSWKNEVLGSRLHSKERYMILAKKGLFCSSVLFCAEKPVAFLVGYVFKDMYMGVETVFKESYRKYSPGILMFFYIVKELIEHTNTRKINVGYGDSEFKRKISNHHSQDATFVLLRKTVKNRIILATHALFSFIKNGAKTIKSS